MSFDIRDFRFQSTVTGLPLAADLRKFDRGIENQHTTNSCTANAVVSAIEILLERAGKFADMSRLFCYYNARDMDGLGSRDSGANLLTAIKAVAKYGVCTEATWPFDARKVLEKPTPNCYTEAERTRITRYETTGVYSRNAIDLMRAALASGYPVVISAKLSAHIHSLRPTEVYRGSLDGARTDFLHAMCLVGYDANGFIIENSWGANWCDKGYMHMPYEVAIKDIFISWVIKAVSGVAVVPLWEAPKPTIKVFVGHGSQFTAMQPCHVIGATGGGESLIVGKSAYGITTDANIESLTLDYPIEALQFMVWRTLLHIYSAGTVIVSWQLNDTHTMQIGDKSYRVSITGNDKAFIDGKAVSTTTPERVAL